MGISFETEPRKDTPWGIGLLVIVLIAAGLGWWQRDRLPDEIQNRLPAAVSGEATATPLPVFTSPPETGQIKLVYSSVVTDAQLPAVFPVQLYLPEAEHADNPVWMGPSGRTDVQTYTVKAGDTLWAIATTFELSIDSLLWANPALEINPNLLSLGSELVILPVDGVYHTVTEEDTLAKIAGQYGVAEADIINYPGNELLPPYNLSPGRKLVAPYGRKTPVVLPPPPADADYPLAWPLAGKVAQNYTPAHPGLDLGSAYGAGVYAAAAGTVIYARPAAGYGYTVVIDHGEGRQTLYSHLKTAQVVEAETVSRGQAIGEVGSTGASGGPYIHFEVHDGGQRLNPLDFLRPR